ncbi:hypothetical protein [Shimia abyssi]|uniref:Tripartite tricarboxylate transporter TctB family protein n=1 Tax=Shimia abyssi TaxID=1662395 RepID=A0A2P8FF70_9RHOB|nr:hypothetical protein [Shimia abyssi]PSL20367.1 hypothetical protein CLV88_1038 [Shimia abyssi]
MNNSDELVILRARDFWTSLVLMAASVFFIWRSSFIPLFGGNRAGVSGADWYNSAAIVPLGIFGCLLVLSFVLLFIAVRSGGAKTALSAAGVGWNRAEARRFSTIGVILFFYVAGLVPRVDFVICSGLLITALIYGFHLGKPQRMLLSAAIVAVAGAYAMAAHLPRSEWAQHDDDLLALVLWISFTVWVVLQNRGTRLAWVIPTIALTAPLVLVCAMAFGFRQNVPNRGGLIFKQIEYHYFVSLKPLWSR